jgi:tRNA nucleotidyltransferase (CCA-adding enzyme)
VARLRHRLPLGAAHVLDWIRRADGAAYLVGGAVRDAFMSRPILDWDIATNLEPDRVAALFPRVVLSGVKHGTVMVITPTGPVEVTTFRGEGPYVDGRRPSRVYFHEDLPTDLARRDFTINAMAADLRAGTIVDPFGGQRDLCARRIRCVGDPHERFAEDGLRPLRALRFSAILGFSLHRGTRAALRGALPTFERVAIERKRDEMEKLLGHGSRLKSALGLLSTSGMLHRLAPSLDRAPASLAVRLEKLPPDPYLRLAAWGVGAGLDARAACELVVRWKGSRRQQSRVGACVGAVWVMPRAPAARQLRHWLADCGVQAARDAARVAAALWPNHGELPARLARVLRQRPPLTVADLAVNGDDMAALGVRGRAIGTTLDLLLTAVLDRPARNRRELLLEAARELSTG